jgi:mono/diheme cytochrome c family protein/uncharacterized membrane protein
MATHRSPVNLCGLARLLLVLGLGGWQLAPPAAVRAQADAAQLFRRHCAKCHGKDGTGSQARGLQPDIPDFTAAVWQARRSDAQLQVSILEGKGQDMPPFGGKISEDQARDFVAHVRAFAPATGKPGRKKQQAPGSSSAFEHEFHRLQEEMDTLQEQSREQSHGSADKEQPKPSESSPRLPPSESSGSAPRPAPSQLSAPAAGEDAADRELFRQHCAKCHGADGTGSQVRRRQPTIPNFADPAWQARRSDAQLLANILNGKGKEMPPWRGKVSAEQARGLVADVRAFTPTAPTPEGGPQASYNGRPLDPEEEQEEPAPGELAAAPPPQGFCAKLIVWLGKFHSPVVHFPIALLTAAAVAELLRLATGQLAFDAVARFCVWFGALTAVVAGVLGWFWGHFRLTDASWAMMTHRWLGTSTVAGAVLVLVLTEVSRRPDRRRTRIWFRVALLVAAALVLATGFFGGVVVFGLDHYTWPQ